MEDEKILDIYTAKLTFRKTRKNSKVVTVQIRFSKKGHQIKEKLPFPEDIGNEDLYWAKYKKERISVYHRIGDNYKYKNMENSIVCTSLSQKLENLVQEILRQNSE